MNNQPPEEDRKLVALLRQARPAPALPPRFQASVWRRIEAGRAPSSPPSFADRLAFLLLKPRFALATALFLVLAGAWLGTHQGSRLAVQDAQSRYLASVMPGDAP